jgi:hypothetical protein
MAVPTSIGPASSNPSVYPPHGENTPVNSPLLSPPLVATATNTKKIKSKQEMPRAVPDNQSSQVSSLRGLLLLLLLLLSLQSAIYL